MWCIHRRGWQSIPAMTSTAWWLLPACHGTPVIATTKVIQRGSLQPLKRYRKVIYVTILKGFYSTVLSFLGMSISKHTTTLVNSSNQTMESPKVWDEIWPIQRKTVARRRARWEALRIQQIPRRRVSGRFGRFARKPANIKRSNWGYLGQLKGWFHPWCSKWQFP